MQINLHIEVDEDNDYGCGNNCPFLEERNCLLFNSFLESIIDDGYALVERDFRCWKSFKEEKE